MINAYQINEGRSVIYNFLSRSLWDIPDSNYLTMFEDLYLSIIEMLKNSNNGDLKKSWKILELFGKNKSLLNDKSKANNIIIELSKEYTRLFYLGINSIPVCESAYVSSLKAYMQEPWEEVKKTFEINNFFPENKGNKPEDHISLELLFMSYLSKKASIAAEQNNERQLKAIYKEQLLFIEEHLFRWTDDFCEKVLNLATNKNSLYVAVILLLRGYLKEDYNFLREEVRN